jgi:ectoine hydroxylase-related dioxygenase (phytanoyl-CoA dioxygenase family)
VATVAGATRAHWVYAFAMSSGGNDFDTFHRVRLPAEVGARDGGAAAARDVGDGRTLAFQLDDGRAYTYRATRDGVLVEPGADGAAAVAELDAAAFDDLVNERWTIFGLLYPGRMRVTRGSFDDVASWEAALTNLWFGRPIYEGAGGDVDALDLDRSFRLGEDDDAEIAHFLRTAGFLVLRGVYTADEIAHLDAEVRRLQAVATPSDNRSWWATNAEGDEVCCRLTYTNERSSFLATLHEDPRLRRIASWHDGPLRSAPDRLDGHSVVIKNSDVVQGLSDLPWHRDCGMGGHPTLCPSVGIGIQLDRADADNGQIWYLAGSHRHTNRIAAVDRHPEWPVVRVEAEPGDVTVHYAHVLHVAPPPTGADAHRRTLYVTFSNLAVFDVVPPGKGYNDVVFSQGDGRVRAPAELA